MNSLNPKLFLANILGTLAWMQSAQSLFGMIGAFVGAFSALMLVCINWEKFTQSTPVRAFAASKIGRSVISFFTRQ